MKRTASPALVAFYANRSLPQPRAAGPVVLRSPAEEPPHTNDLGALLAHIRQRSDELTANAADMAAVESELRKYLAETGAHDRVANDNGTWTKARRASSQPALHSFGYRTA